MIVNPITALLYKYRCTDLYSKSVLAPIATPLVTSTYRQRRLV